MFGWFNSKAREIKKLERKYQQELEYAEAELSRSGDRARHGDLIAKAEATGRQLDELRQTEA